MTSLRSVGIDSNTAYHLNGSKRRTFKIHVTFKTTRYNFPSQGKSRDTSNKCIQPSRNCMSVTAKAKTSRKTIAKTDQSTAAKKKILKLRAVHNRSLRVPKDHTSATILRTD
jgi:hypothetical protein